MSSSESRHAWSLLSVLIPAEAEEHVTAVFLEEDAAARATGLVVEDADAGILATGDAPPPPGLCRISTYAPASEGAAVAAALSARLDGLVALGLLPRAPEITTQPVDMEGLHERWKDFFHVVHVSDRIVIRPPWREYTPRPNEIVVEIEPGMAFGTGGHQTTQLCLRGLEAALASIPPGDEPVLVLDVGCGSGVLAVAAAKLGALQAVALDVDPAALEATRENAERNGVTEQIRVFEEPVSAVGRLSADFSVVVANIISGTLLELRDDLLAATRPGGTLLLSGLLTDEEDEFQKNFAPPGAELVHREAMDEWLCLGYRLPHC